MSMQRVIEYIADIEGKIEQNLRAKGYSSRIITMLKKTKDGVTLNGTPKFMIDKACIGDVITVKIVEQGEKIAPYNAPISFVYQDQDLAVINKSPDIATIGTNAHYGKCLMNALASVWGEYVFHPVNRLDKGTSGLMIVAKHCFAHSILSNQMAERAEEAINRQYLALVRGDLQQDITIDEPIGMPYETTLIRGVDYVNGKSAKTVCHVVERLGEYTLVELTLESGRTHQIRVHMSHIGHPLVGDELYGGEIDAIQRPCLHCHRIAFYHPVTQEKILLESPLYPDIVAVLNKIKSTN